MQLSLRKIPLKIERFLEMKKETERARIK